MADLVQPQMVDIDAVLAVHALQQEQPPPQPVDNVAAPVNAAPGETNAAPAQVQVRFLSCAQCNVIRSPVVWVHDVCILVYCPDIPSLFPCLLKFPLFPLYYNEFGSYIWLIAALQLSFLSCFCLSRGANLVRPYTLSQDGVLVFRGLRDAGLGRCIGYFYNLSIPV